ncbi:MAG TPA: ComEC/Rec2 family competence protein [Clostridia bacterium]|nr:ComEC/Rec2 family competence protein [Clostridia bacterium]
MARQKKRLTPLGIIAAVAVLAFVLFANLGDRNVFPGWLQNPVNTANSATGHLIFPDQPAKIENLEVCFFDVGQADSIFVSCDGATMLIDAGNPDDSDTVENNLKRLGVTSLDYVVGTHPHSDHIGGLSQIISDFNVKEIMMTGTANNTNVYYNLLKTIQSKGKKITKPAVGKTTKFGGGSFTVDAPNAAYEDMNNDSIVIRFTYHKLSFLFTGDASKDSEKDMLSRHDNLQADVLKVGHHGSQTATSAAFLKAVNPRYAVISVGASNSYGLPDESVISRLENAGVKVFRTDENGTVIFKSDGDTITCNTEK